MPSIVSPLQNVCFAGDFFVVVETFKDSDLSVSTRWQSKVAVARPYPCRLDSTVMREMDNSAAATRKRNRLSKSPR